MKTREISIQSFIVPTLPFASLLIALSLGFWIISYLFSGLSYSQELMKMSYWELFLLPNTILSNLVSFIFTLINAILLSQINTKFNLIRNRTFLPFFIFLLLMSTWTDTHVMNGSSIGLSFFALAIFLFFEVYRNPMGTEQVFLASFLIGLSSLIVLPYVFFILIIWIGLMMFQSFSVRTFLASIFGLFNPWVFYLIGIYYFDQNFNILAFFQSHLTPDFSIPIMNKAYQIYGVFLALIVGIAIVGLFIHSNQDSIHTRKKNNVLLLFLIALVVLSFVYSGQVIYFVPFIAFLSALLVSHAFSLQKGLLFPILFYLMCTGSILFFIITKVFSEWLILLS